MRLPCKDRLWLVASVLVFVGAAEAEAQTGASPENWTVPEWSSKATDVSRPVTFVAVTPCRIVDTRDPAGPYGGPNLPPATRRDFDLNNGPCAAIPPIVAAYSLNFTVTQTQGFGDLRAWPAGSAPPLVSTLNYVPNQTVANAAIVPAGANGAISVVAAVSGTHLIIDINGYYTDHPNLDNSVLFEVFKPGGMAIRAGNLDNAPNSIGVQGFTWGNGGYAFGVVGSGFNADTGEGGGVLGAAGLQFNMPSNYGPSGVRGIHRDSFGVLGITESNTALAVAGSNVAGFTEQSWGGLACSNTIAVCGMGTSSISGTKSFVEPDPTDASRVIKYVSLEGNEAGTYFRGRARFQNGLARIAVPRDFRLVTAAEDLSIQVTPIGEMVTVAVVRIDLEQIVVKASRNVEFFYLVQGKRKGYEDFDPTAEDAFFAPRSADYRMPEALSAEAKRKLIANGTYNPDGTVNMETAERLGWTKKWKGGSAPKKE